jgi:hypothetical protein
MRSLARQVAQEVGTAPAWVVSGKVDIPITPVVPVIPEEALYYGEALLMYDGDYLVYSAEESVIPENAIYANNEAIPDPSGTGYLTYGV